MPLLTLNFQPEVGAILNVGIARPISLLSEEEKKSPVIRPVRMLVDTGATRTSISTNIANELGLPVIGQVPMRSVTHEVASNLYLADLIWTVGQPTPLTDMQLMDFPMADGQIDGLIGRDILQYGMFIMNGPSHSFTLAH